MAQAVSDEPSFDMRAIIVWRGIGKDREAKAEQVINEVVLLQQRSASAAADAVSEFLATTTADPAAPVLSNNAP